MNMHTLELNDDENLDLKPTLLNYFENLNDADQIEDNPYSSLSIECSYFEESSLFSKISGSEDFLLLNGSGPGFLP